MLLEWSDGKCGVRSIAQEVEKRSENAEYDVILNCEARQHTNLGISSRVADVWMLVFARSLS